MVICQKNTVNHFIFPCSLFQDLKFTVHDLFFCEFYMGQGPITVKYHVPWSREFWRHGTLDDAIIFFAKRSRQKLTLHSKTEFC